MTRKDLNLSLDTSLMQDRPAAQPARNHIAEVATHPKSVKQSQTPPQPPRRNISALTTALIAVTNMVFLLLAGLWLSTLPITLATPNPSIAANTTPQLALMLAETNERLATVERQLSELNLAVTNPRQATIDQPEVDQGSQKTPALADKSAITVSTKEIKPAVDNWYVNLGTFNSKDAAVGVENQLQSIGRRANIIPRAQNGSTAYEMRVSGFEDREAAEKAAGDIMEQTDLSSLWVWEDAQVE